MSINDILIDENNKRERERERERERDRERQREFKHAMSFLPPFTTQSSRVKSTIHALVFFIWLWRSFFTRQWRNSRWNKCRNHPLHNSLVEKRRSFKSEQFLSAFAHTVSYYIWSPRAENWIKFHHNDVMAPSEAMWQCKSLKLKDLFLLFI